MINFIIEHIITEDDPFTGDAVVPGCGDEFFAVVRRHGNGRTVWRHIRLSSSPVTDWRAAPGDQTRAP
jgi:hypothetical protein